MQRHACVSSRMRIHPSTCSTQPYDDFEGALQRAGARPHAEQSALPPGTCFTNQHDAFDGAMQLQGRAHMLSNMRYHTSVVIYLFAALGTLGVSSRKLMKLSAYSDRISELEATVKDVGSGKTGESSRALGGPACRSAYGSALTRAKKHNSGRHRR